jgi:hypothetical protein
MVCRATAMLPRSAAADTMVGEAARRPTHPKNGLILSVVVAWLVWIATYILDIWVHGRIRARFRIAGDWCTDCALVSGWWCCTTCQEAHHVDRATRLASEFA